MFFTVHTTLGFILVSSCFLSDRLITWKTNDDELNSIRLEMTALDQRVFLLCESVTDPHQIVVCVFGLEHACDVSQVAQVRLLEAVLREGHRNNAFRHIGEVELISLLHLQTGDSNHPELQKLTRTSM